MEYTQGPVTEFSGILIGHQTSISYISPCGATDFIFGRVSGTIKNVAFDLKYNCPSSGP